MQTEKVPQEISASKGWFIVGRLLAGILLAGILSAIAAWHGDRVLIVLGAVFGFVAGYVWGGRAFGAALEHFWGG